jgi:uncharacterized protein (TIGR02145 family)
MKAKSLFFPCVMLVLAGFTFCERPEPYGASPTIHGKVITDLPDEETNLSEDSIADVPSVSAPETDNNPADYFNPDLTYGSITDIEGTIYRTIQIGAQTWMAENLRTTLYNDGTMIPDVTWPEIDISNKDLYGAFYNHYVVNSGKLCPTGWHVPSDEEWKQLEMELGMSRASADTSYGDFDVYGTGERGTDQGAKLKSAAGWLAWGGQLFKGNNSSGFSALPTGDYYGGTTGCCTTFWCSGDAWGRSLSSTDSKVGRAIYYEHYGLSVRCLKN